MGSLDNLRRSAKRWLKALRAGDAEARERLRRAYPAAPDHPGLRDVQHALAREHGVESWTALKARIAEADARPDDSHVALGELLLAAGTGDLSRLGAVLDRHPALVSERGTLPGHTGLRTALHFGIRHEAIVRALLDRGADPNVRDEGDNATALHFAAENQDPGIIRALVEHGADPNGEGDGHELAVIGWASCWDYREADPAIVDYLLAHGARHHIFSAVAMGDVATVRALVARSPAELARRMDVTNKRRTPLHLAVVKKQPQVLETLLDLGADANAVDAAGLTPLDQAALGGEAQLAERLIARGARLRLPAAVLLQRTDDVERLLRDDPGCLKPGQHYGTLIVHVSSRAPGNVVDTLIRLGADVNVSDDPSTALDGAIGYTPLHAAAFHGNRDAAAVLLKHGANVNLRDDKYCGTPAGWADHAGHGEVRDLILAGPIDIFQAIQFDRVARLPEILARDPGALNRPFREYGRCPPRTNQWWPGESCTPLEWAIMVNKPDALRYLRDAGADASTA